jgi:biotin carboxyl carrier protein
MHQIKVNDFSFETDTAGGTLLINGNEVDADISKINSSTWHIIINFQSYTAEVVSFNRSEKTAGIRVNNNVYTITAKDQFDMLLEKSGLGKVNAPRLTELRAPMPGMVLKTFVGPGAAVKNGDNLFILEAMKMENIIKATADGNIKLIKIKAGDKVEKGEILIEFI